MSNGRKRMIGAFSAAVLAAAGAPVAAPGAAQTGAESGEESPPVCSIRTDYYSCCRPYDPCTQIFIDAPLPPEEPVEPPKK